jgi:hypothetical protein
VDDRDVVTRGPQPAANPFQHLVTEQAHLDGCLRCASAGTGRERCASRALDTFAGLLELPDAAAASP